MAKYVIKRKSSGSAGAVVLVGGGIMVYGMTQSMNSVMYGGAGLCVLAGLILSLLCVLGRRSARRQPQVLQVVKTSSQIVEQPVQSPSGPQNPGNTANQFPGQQYPTTIAPNCVGGVPSQSVGVPGQYPGGVPCQHAGGVPCQHAGGVPYQHAGGVPCQHAGGVPCQHAGGVPCQHAGVPTQFDIIEVHPQEASSAPDEPNTSVPLEPEILAQVPPPSYDETISSDKK